MAFAVSKRRLFPQSPPTFVASTPPFLLDYHHRPARGAEPLARIIISHLCVSFDSLTLHLPAARGQVCERFPWSLMHEPAFRGRHKRRTQHTEDSEISNFSCKHLLLTATESKSPHQHTSIPPLSHPIHLDARRIVNSTSPPCIPSAKMSSDQVAVCQTASPQTSQKRHQSSTSPHRSIQDFATTPPFSPDPLSQQPSAQALPALSTSNQVLSPPRALENSRPEKSSSAEDMPFQESDLSDDEFLGVTGPECIFCDMCLDTEPPCCCPSCQLPN